MSIKEHNKPLVSVVIAAYNAEEYLDLAIESVVGQTVNDWELFVIDDHSKDGTYAVAQAWEQKDDRIHALTNEQNQGVSRTRNRGIDLAQGEYIAILDADDIWFPEKLERQLRKFVDSDIAMVYCSYDIINAQGQTTRPRYHVPGSVSYEELLRENVILCSSMLIPARILKKYKFTVDFYHEDYVLSLNILKDGYRAVGCEETLASWRLIENSRSFDKRKAAKNRWRIYREYLHLPLYKTMAVFGAYTIAGMKKYFWGK